jgi:hypothetical protein
MKEYRKIEDKSEVIESEVALRHKKDKKGAVAETVVTAALRATHTTPTPTTY